MRDTVDVSPPQAKCKLCKKIKGLHKAGNLACPFGSKHRTLGYTQFHMDQFFHAVEKRMEKNEKL